MTEDMNNQIDTIVKNNRVVLFMKGSPDFPQCGFSSVVARILEHLNVPFHHVNVLEDNNMREGIKIYSNWPTIPQVYIDQEFIGGCDIMKEMFETQEIHTLLQEKGLYQQ